MSAGAVQSGGELRPSEPVLGGAGTPVLAQPCQVDVLLPLARLDRRPLGRVEPGRRPLPQMLDDLRPARRELGDDCAGNAPQFGHPLARSLPLDAQRPGQFRAQVRLVEVAGSEPVGLQDRLAVQGAPLAVAGSQRHVGHDHVGVQVRILRSRCPVLVGGRDEPRCALADEAARASPNDAGLVLEVGERGLPGCRVRLVDHVAGLIVPESVQEADALGDREDEVEAGDGAERLLLQSSGAAGRIDSLDGDRAGLRMAPSQSLTGAGVIAADQHAELAIADDSVQGRVRQPRCRPRCPVTRRGPRSSRRCRPRPTARSRSPGRE